VGSRQADAQDDGFRNWGATNPDASFGDVGFVAASEVGGDARTRAWSSAAPPIDEASVCSRPMTDVVSLAEAAGTDVARVLTDAFLDDPGWRDVGPERELHRRLVMWGYHRALQRKALRWGRPGYAAFRDGQLVGVAVTFDHEAWPPPEPISTLLNVPAFALAGPFAAMRGWRADTMMKRVHFHDLHVFLWQLAVDPPVQRSGVGHALMARVVADADDAELPVYLETAKPENVPYYRSFGFVETGCERLPRGAPLWLMLRPHA
jgi:GNAT superfamily N-acetyltransferase